jgi:hypothetical protein
MEINQQYSFQTDAPVVQKQLKDSLNYKIEYDNSQPQEYCVIYFSSNDLYYPNNESTFKSVVIDKNRFEWYGNRIAKAHKHIFIRDVRKQWYVGGISAIINSPKKLLEFLREETKGYQSVFLGSSAGGFAAVIYGQLLSAKYIMSFNGQFEVLSLLAQSNEKKDPLLYRFSSDPEHLPYFDSTNFIVKPSSIYYFHSMKSKWDSEQNDFVKGININRIKFNSNNHGLPFYRFNLANVINFDESELNSLSKRKQINPLHFSFRILGVFNTLINLVKLYIGYALKLSFRKIKKLFTS